MSNDTNTLPPLPAKIELDADYTTSGPLRTVALGHTDEAMHAYARAALSGQSVGGAEPVLWIDREEWRAGTDPRECVFATQDQTIPEWMSLIPLYDHAPPRAAADDSEFKNFHRQLCEQVGYRFDPLDWKRDQASLIEYIGRAAEPVSPTSASREHFSNGITALAELINLPTFEFKQHGEQEFIKRNAVLPRVMLLRASLDALAKPAAPAQPVAIPGLMSMTDDDDGWMTLRFVSDDAAQTFMRDHEPSADVEAPQPTPEPAEAKRKALADPEIDWHLQDSFKQGVEYGKKLSAQLPTSAPEPAEATNRPSKEWYRQKIAELGDDEPSVIGAGCPTSTPGAPVGGDVAVLRDALLAADLAMAQSGILAVHATRKEIAEALAATPPQAERQDVDAAMVWERVKDAVNDFAAARIDTLKLLEEISSYGYDRENAAVRKALAATEKAEPDARRLRVLGTDEARLALWQAMNETEKFANRSDDKVVIARLAGAGVYLAASAPASGAGVL